MLQIDEKVMWAFKELNAPHEAPWVSQFINTKVSKSESGFLEAQKLLDKIIEDKKSGKPLAYIFGSWPFMNLDLKVGEGVLIPRPETEELCEFMVDRYLDHKGPLRVLDLGAGTGALGLGFSSALLAQNNNVELELFAYERSQEAFKYLSENAECLKTDKHLENKSWVELIDKPIQNMNVILGNPPYVSDFEWKDVDKSVKEFEPYEALCAENLTELQKQLAKNLDIQEEDLEAFALGPFLENLEVAHLNLANDGIFAIEIGPAQAQFLFTSSKAYKDLNFVVEEDMSSKPRFVVGNKNG